MRGTWSAFVNQQIAHGNVGITKVSTENRFAEKIVESAACRVATEERAPLVPRAVKLKVARLNILFKAPKEWRQ